MNKDFHENKMIRFYNDDNINYVPHHIVNIFISIDFSYFVYVYQVVISNITSNQPDHNIKSE